jgi:hypothetical protein
MGREAWVVERRERRKTVWARGASLAAVAGRSSSTLDVGGCEPNRT